MKTKKLKGEDKSVIWSVNYNSYTEEELKRKEESQKTYKVDVRNRLKRLKKMHKLEEQLNQLRREDLQQLIKWTELRK